MSVPHRLNTVYSGSRRATARSRRRPRGRSSSTDSVRPDSTRAKTVSSRSSAADSPVSSQASQAQEGNGRATVAPASTVTPGTGPVAMASVSGTAPGERGRRRMRCLGRLVVHGHAAGDEVAERDTGGGRNGTGLLAHLEVDARAQMVDKRTGDLRQRGEALRVGDARVRLLGRPVIPPLAVGNRGAGGVEEDRSVDLRAHIAVADHAAS